MSQLLSSHTSWKHGETQEGFLAKGLETCVVNEKSSLDLGSTTQVEGAADVFKDEKQIWTLGLRVSRLEFVTS